MSHLYICREKVSGRGLSLLASRGMVESLLTFRKLVDATSELSGEDAFVDGNVPAQLDAKASPTLEWLSFHRTRLNETSLKSLGGMPSLKYLDDDEQSKRDARLGNKSACLPPISSTGAPNRCQSPEH